MNKWLLLQWVINHADMNRYKLETESQEELRKLLLDELTALNGQQKVELPDPLPEDSQKMLSILRTHFDDNVTLISRTLNHYFPEEYLFYRISNLEDEIFQSFNFFAEIVPEFDFAFSSIGRNGFDNYLKLNEALLTFARRVWLDIKDPQTILTWFLYNGLGALFVEKSDYNRYWVMVTRPEHFETLDNNDEVSWSARKEMQVGDLVFFYRTSPRSAITDIFEVIEEPYFDTWAEWDGFWVKLARVSTIPDITYSEMSKDTALKDWNALRKKFFGVRTDLIQHSIYNRLLDKIPASTKKQYDLNPEPMTQAAPHEYTTEAEFEREFVEPLMKRWNFRYQTQYLCSFWVGRQSYRGRVDVFVEGVTLFENKLRIINDRELKPAVEQGKSYALLLGLPSFVVASPEGLWIYSLDKNQEKLEEHIPMPDLPAKDEEIRSLLLSFSK